MADKDVYERLQEAVEAVMEYEVGAGKGLLAEWLVVGCVACFNLNEETNETKIDASYVTVPSASDVLPHRLLGLLSIARSNLVDEIAFAGDAWNTDDEEE